MTCILVPWVTPPTSRAPHLALYFSRRVQTAPVPPAFTLCAHFGSAERDKPDRVIEGVRNKPTHDRQTGLVLLSRPLCGTRLLAPLLLLLYCTAPGRGPWPAQCPPTGPHKSSQTRVQTRCRRQPKMATRLLPGTEYMKQ